MTAGCAMRHVVGPTFNNHAEYLRFGDWFCEACSWLYSQVHGKPGNVLAVGDQLYKPLISLDAAAAGDRVSWRDVLLQIAELPPETPVAGVLTTDVKPRLWPRMPLASIGAFALYVHAPEYDLSTAVAFDLRRFRAILGLIEAARAAGWRKARIWHGLWSDYARAAKDPALTSRIEAQLQAVRSDPAFLPALLAAGKGGSHDQPPVRPGDRPARPADAGATARGGDPPAELRLL